MSPAQKPKPAPKKRRRKAPSKPAPLPLGKAVRQAIDAAEKKSPGVATSVDASLAVTLAAHITAEDGEPLSARATAAKVLRETMNDIAGVEPEAKPADGLDELTQRREKRQAKAAAK